MREVMQHEDLVKKVAYRVHNKFLSIDVEDLQQELWLCLISAADGLSRVEILDFLFIKARKIRQEARKEAYNTKGVKRRLQFEQGSSHHNGELVIGPSMNHSTSDQNTRSRSTWLRMLDEWDHFMLQRSEVDQKIILMVSKGYRQQQMADKLGIGQPRVHRRLRRLLNEFKEYHTSIKEL